MEDNQEEKVIKLDEQGVVPESTRSVLDHVFSQIVPFLQRQSNIIFNGLRYFRMGGENKVIVAHDQQGFWIGHAEYASAPFKVDLSGNLYTGGSLKTAVVKTGDGARELYCIESPEVWFVDFCKRERVPSPFWNKKYIYYLDPLFAQVTQEPYHYIPTAKKDIYQVWGKRRFFAHKRFERVSEEDMKYNNRFWKGQRPQRKWKKRTNKV